MDMPKETQEAVDWAFQQEGEIAPDVYIPTKENDTLLFDKIREYFNKEGIDYGNYTWSDVEPYMNNSDFA